MKTRLLISAFSLLLSLPLVSVGQEQWPRELSNKSNGRITIYQPQPESLNEGVLVARSAVSVRKTSNAEPVFGVVWIEGILRANQNRNTYTLENVKVHDARFPDTEDANFVAAIKSNVANEVAMWPEFMPIDQLNSLLNNEKEIATNALNNEAPTIIFTEKPTLLVNIDGTPFLRIDKDLNMERVMNSPFLIVKNPDDKSYYLYGEGYWYKSSAITGGWRPISQKPTKIAALDRQIAEYAKENNLETSATALGDFGPPEILVTTDPSELIQSDGAPNFASVEGTSLLYMTNTRNSIFMHIDTQKYYLLLSGRWYVALKLHGPWAFTSADRLPADFANIPEGSNVDGVLANVPGTSAAREAVMDTYVPQTARIDRNNTQASVEYDGEPVFEPIRGTNMQYAVNTSGSVILHQNNYYAVDNGVWFMSRRPYGPWVVAVERPYDVMYIPASYPVYNMRFVHIYDVGPQYVYMGYSQGYLGSYVYGNTVVYGTGFRYNPWYGNYYYARPFTYGFGMYYNPWAGWSMNYGYSAGWFSFNYRRGPRWAGWWGPPMYCPPYRPYHYHGMYHYSYYRPVRNNVFINNTVVVNNYHNHNVYRSHRNVVTSDRYNRNVVGGRVQPSNRAAANTTRVQTTSRGSTGRTGLQPANTRNAGVNRGNTQGRASQGVNQGRTTTGSRNSAIGTGNGRTATQNGRVNTNSSRSTVPQSRVQSGHERQSSAIRSTSPNNRVGTSSRQVEAGTNRNTQPAMRAPANNGRVSSTPNRSEDSNGSRVVAPGQTDRNAYRNQQGRSSAPAQRNSSQRTVEPNTQTRSTSPSSTMRSAPTRSAPSGEVQRGAAPQSRKVERSTPTQRQSAPSVQQRTAPAPKQSAPSVQRSAPAPRQSAPSVQRSSPAPRQSAPAVKQRSAPAPRSQGSNRQIQSGSSGGGRSTAPAPRSNSGNSRRGN